MPVGGAFGGGGVVFARPGAETHFIDWVNVAWLFNGAWSNHGGAHTRYLSPRLRMVQDNQIDKEQPPSNQSDFMDGDRPSKLRFEKNIPSNRHFWQDSCGRFRDFSEKFVQQFPHLDTSRTAREIGDGLNLRTVIL